MSEMKIAYDVVIVEKKGKYALKQFSTNKLLTDYLYSGIEDLKNGFFKVQESGWDYLDFLCGVIRYDGNEILPCKYSDISFCFNNTYIIVENTDYFTKKGLYNLSGKETIPCQYDHVIVDGNFIRVGKAVSRPFPHNDDLKWGLYSHEGKLLLDVKYNSIVDIKELGIVKFNFDIYVVSDSSNRLTTKSETDRPFCYSPIVLTDSHYFIENEIKIPLKFYIDKNVNYYIVVDSFGHAVNKADSRYLNDGFLNYSLKPIPAEYVEPVVLCDGNIVCKKRQTDDGFYGLINASGEVILPFKYDEIKTVPNALRTYQILKDGTHDIFIQKNESEYCEKLFKGRYNELEYCGYTGKFAIIHSITNKCGLVSIDERKKIIPCIYDNIYMENHQIIVLGKGINGNENILDLYSTEQRKIIRSGCMGIKSNLYYYGFRECKYNTWDPLGDKNQVAIAININGKWQLLNAKFEDIGLPLYDEVEFSLYGVDCYIKSNIANVYDYFGHDKQYQNSNTIDEYESGAMWEELGKDEEDYIINNGGDWILDNG